MLKCLISFHLDRSHCLWAQQPAAMYRQKIELWYELNRVSKLGFGRYYIKQNCIHQIDSCRNDLPE